MTTSNFTRWMDRLINEKGIDLDQMLHIEGPSGLNMMPVGVVVDAIKGAPAHEQAGIKNMLVKIDFVAPGAKPVVDYLAHLGRAIAI